MASLVSCTEHIRSVFLDTESRGGQLVQVPLVLSCWSDMARSSLSKLTLAIPNYSPPLILSSCSLGLVFFPRSARAAHHGHSGTSSLLVVVVPSFVFLLFISVCFGHFF